ncbi:MAG: hypothetical protein IT384_12600 [Deltaproteobacteria bacterium]|nr:hypothetical protein [Deltaproteobacteria bacterium]
MTQVRTRDAQRTFAKSLRDDAAAAANPKGTIQKERDSELSPFLENRAAALRTDHPRRRVTIDRLVDRGMKDAMKVWNEFNPPSPPRNHRFLSGGEVRKIWKADPNLGVLTESAVDLVRALTPTRDASRVPVVTLVSPDPGITLEQRGDIFTLSAASTVPSGTTFKLIVGGAEIPLQRYANGLSEYNLAGSLPEGYGARDITRETDKVGNTTAKVRISKDPAGWLTSEQALAKARDALTEYTRTRRVKDSDWKDMIGKTWEEAVAAGVLEDIAKFGAPNPDASNGVERRPDSYLFVGSGPMGLYTEVGVRKRDGKPLNVYVEID